MLRQLGVDTRVQQEVLRHADIRITMNVYRLIENRSEIKTIGHFGTCRAGWISYAQKFIGRGDRIWTFEPTPAQPFQTLAELGWQPKHRNGSQRNINWTRIGHCRLPLMKALKACDAIVFVTLQRPRPSNGDSDLPVGANLLALMISDGVYDRAQNPRKCVISAF